MVLLVGGAKEFIVGVEGVSNVLGVSPLLLSLIIVPIATELPEKVNSIIWAANRSSPHAARRAQRRKYLRPAPDIHLAVGQVRGSIDLDGLMGSYGTAQP